MFKIKIKSRSSKGKYLNRKFWVNGSPYIIAFYNEKRESYLLKNINEDYIISSLYYDEDEIYEREKNGVWEFFE